MVRRKGKRRIPPSRQRYEESHPTVTVRVDRALYDELKTLKERTGHSFADILKIGLDKLQVVEEEIHTRGYMEGLDFASKAFQVRYRCARCHRLHLTITRDKEKQDAADLMYQAGWYDPTCPDI